MFICLGSGVCTALLQIKGRARTVPAPSDSCFPRIQNYRHDKRQILTSFNTLLFTLVTSLVIFANLRDNRLLRRTVCSLNRSPLPITHPLSTALSTLPVPLYFSPCIMRGLDDFYPRNDFSYFIENRHCYGCSRTEKIHFTHTSKWPMAYTFNKIFNKLWAHLYVRIQPTRSFGRVFSSFLKRRNKMRFQGMWIRQQKDWEDIAQPPKAPWPLSRGIQSSSHSVWHFWFLLPVSGASWTPVP